MSRSDKVSADASERLTYRAGDITCHNAKDPENQGTLGQRGVA
jgi:hypothetical protein